MMCLIYHVISSSITSAGTWMIICTWNSQIASSLSQIWVSCSTLLMTSFPLEKNIQWLNRDQRHPPWLPGFSFAQISPLLWSFFSILVEFHWDRGIEWREILNQYTSGTAIIISNNKIFLAFYNNFDTTCRMVIYMYILPRNKILLFPKWLQRPTRSILLYSLVMNMGKVNFRNYTNSYKIIKNSCNDIFFHSGDQEKKDPVTVANTYLGIRWTLSVCEEELDKDYDMSRMPGYCLGWGVDTAVIGWCVINL